MMIKGQNKLTLDYRHVWLKPADGLAVVDPETGKNLPPEGALVENSKYWRRRLKDGDVLEAAAPVSSAPVKKSSKKED
jgi:hypothetical protein